MEKALSKLSKLQKNKTAEILKTGSSETVSKYFSPRRTRNQRKIQYENDIKVDAKSKVKENKEDDVQPILESRIKQDDNEKKKISVSKRKLFTPPDQILIGKKNLKTNQSNSKKIETNLKIEEPNNWQEILQNIKEMRLEKSAPVDTMGCDKCADETLDEKARRYHILVALMLSSQTKDQTTYDAMNRLKERTLTPENIVAIHSEELEKLLCPVSFYKTKAKSLQKTASILIEKYNSDIPNSLEDLVKLPGVGPKMAHICMKSAWNIVTGIGVDVHVHRISNRLHWVRNTNNPEETRIQLESWLPEKYWCEINSLLVGFGQTICTPLKPNCRDCKNQNICPSAFKADTKSKSRNKTK